MKTPNRNGLIAKIKIAQKQLDMADDAYRAMLERVTGKTSCTQMNLAELQAVVEEMKRMGFKQTAPKGKGIRPHLTKDREALLNKLEALLTAGGKSWNYADGMAKKMFGKDLVRFLTPNQLYKLVQALQIHTNREQAGKTGEL
ncbi:gp16 family protein [Neisseria dumasiana]|uniref:GemA protein n=1 Tax=Neisseria dumasiana TaxID=1931275 RepID=A0A1X3DLV4_9NEIS|nr:phage protein GemA/Gp16 family protein [Neisseria dumasiana]OSI25085.1 hypothetical protein BV912_01540 [Neisseria dumasiana]